jgi:hypothetical protein
MCVSKMFFNIKHDINEFQSSHYIHIRLRIRVLLRIKPTIGTFYFVSQVLMKVKVLFLCKVRFEL